MTAKASQADGTPFQEHDYVLYIGQRSYWKGFYLVRRVNPDGTALLRQSSGAEISSCSTTDIQLLYRPTPEQIEQALPKKRIL